MKLNFRFVSSQFQIIFVYLLQRNLSVPGSIIPNWLHFSFFSDDYFNNNKERIGFPRNPLEVISNGAQKVIYKTLSSAIHLKISLKCRVSLSIIYNL
jgi:hypothetical protein